MGTRELGVHAPDRASRAADAPVPGSAAAPHEHHGSLPRGPYVHKTNAVGAF